MFHRLVISNEGTPFIHLGSFPTKDSADQVCGCFKVGRGCLCATIEDPTGDGTRYTPEGIVHVLNRPPRRPGRSPYAT